VGWAIIHWFELGTLGLLCLNLLVCLIGAERFARDKSLARLPDARSMG
jgi:hypothetical protein